MNDKRYISNGTSFDIGTEAILLRDMRPFGLKHGLFLGLHKGVKEVVLSDFNEFIVLGRHSE